MAKITKKEFDRFIKQGPGSGVHGYCAIYAAPGYAERCDVPEYPEGN